MLIRKQRPSIALRVGKKVGDASARLHHPPPSPKHYTAVVQEPPARKAPGGSLHFSRKTTRENEQKLTLPVQQHIPPTYSSARARCLISVIRSCPYNAPRVCKA